jgi:hypothetical protein
MLTLLIAHTHSVKRWSVSAFSKPRKFAAAPRTMTALSISNNFGNMRYPTNNLSFSWKLLFSLKNDEDIKLTEHYFDNYNNNINNVTTAIQDRVTGIGTQRNQLIESVESLPSMVNLEETQNDVAENWVDESKHVELFGLIAWAVSLSAFILMNNFVGPFPEFFRGVNERFFFLGHMMGGMLFGGE